MPKVCDISHEVTSILDVSYLEALKWKQINTNDKIQCFEFNHSGNKLACITDSGVLKIYDCSSQMVLQDAYPMYDAIDTLKIQEYLCQCMQWSLDQGYIIALFSPKHKTKPFSSVSPLKQSTSSLILTPSKQQASHLTQSSHQHQDRGHYLLLFDLKQMKLIAKQKISDKVEVIKAYHNLSCRGFVYSTSNYEYYFISLDHLTSVSSSNLMISLISVDQLTKEVYSSSLDSMDDTFVTSNKANNSWIYRDFIVFHDAQKESTLYLLCHPSHNSHHLMICQVTLSVSAISSFVSMPSTPTTTSSTVITTLSSAIQPCSYQFTCQYSQFLTHSHPNNSHNSNYNSQPIKFISGKISPDRTQLILIVNVNELWVYSLQSKVSTPSKTSTTTISSFEFLTSTIKYSIPNDMHEFLEFIQVFYLPSNYSMSLSSSLTSSTSAKTPSIFQDLLISYHIKPKFKFKARVTDGIILGRLCSSPLQSTSTQQISPSSSLPSSIQLNIYDLSDNISLQNILCQPYAPSSTLSSFSEILPFTTTTTPYPPLVIALDSISHKLVISKNLFQSTFAGTMFPVGYRLLSQIHTYIEREDEVDKIILSPTAALSTNNSSDSSSKGSSSTSLKNNLIPSVPSIKDNNSDILLDFTTNSTSNDTKPSNSLNSHSNSHANLQISQINTQFDTHIQSMIKQMTTIDGKTTTNQWLSSSFNISRGLKRSIHETMETTDDFQSTTASTLSTSEFTSFPRQLSSYLTISNRLLNPLESNNEKETKKHMIIQDIVTNPQLLQENFQEMKEMIFEVQVRKSLNEFKRKFNKQQQQNDILTNVLAKVQQNEQLKTQRMLQEFKEKEENLQRQREIYPLLYEMITQIIDLSCCDEKENMRNISEEDNNKKINLYPMREAMLEVTEDDEMEEEVQEVEEVSEEVSEEVEVENTNNNNESNEKDQTI